MTQSSDLRHQITNKLSQNPSGLFVLASLDVVHTLSLAYPHPPIPLAGARSKEYEALHLVAVICPLLAKLSLHLCKHFWVWEWVWEWVGEWMWVLWMVSNSSSLMKEGKRERAVKTSDRKDCKEKEFIARKKKSSTKLQNHVSLSHCAHPLFMTKPHNDITHTIAAAACSIRRSVSSLSLCPSASLFLSVCLYLPHIASHNQTLALHTV